MVGRSVTDVWSCKFGAKLKILRVRSIKNESESDESLSYTFRYWSFTGSHHRCTERIIERMDDHNNGQPEISADSADDLNGNDNPLEKVTVNDIAKE